MLRGPPNKTLELLQLWPMGLGLREKMEHEFNKIVGDFRSTAAGA